MVLVQFTDYLKIVLYLTSYPIARLIVHFFLKYEANPTVWVILPICCKVGFFKLTLIS